MRRMWHAIPAQTTSYRAPAFRHALLDGWIVFGVSKPRMSSSSEGGFSNPPYHFVEFVNILHPIGILSPTQHLRQDVFLTKQCTLNFGQHLLEIRKLHTTHAIPSSPCPYPCVTLCCVVAIATSHLRSLTLTRRRGNRSTMHMQYCVLCLDAYSAQD